MFSKYALIICIRNVLLSFEISFEIFSFLLYVKVKLYNMLFATNSSTNKTPFKEDNSIWSIRKKILYNAVIRVSKVL